MKKSLFFLAICLGTGCVFAQNGIAVYGGGTISRLKFTPFEQYVEKYNETNSTATQPMKYDNAGTGYEYGFLGRFAAISMGWNISKTTTHPTTAVFADGERHIQFINYESQFTVGGQIAKTIMPYFSFGFSNMHIDSYYMYGDIKSYGGEKATNGVYTSWKLGFAVGARIEHAFGRLSPYFDFCYNVRTKEYLGGSYDLMTNSTQDYSFNADPNYSGDLTGQGSSLEENYGNFRFTLGLAVYLFKFEDKD